MNVVLRLGVAAVLMCAAQGCYWRPGYYLNGGQYATAPPAYPQPYPQTTYPQPYSQPVMTQPMVAQPMVQPMVAQPVMGNPCCQPCVCQ